MLSMSQLTYEHIYQAGDKNKPVFVLLHGTGGNEKDMLPIAQALNPAYGVLSVRGDVDENGQLRYFKRTGMGKYDLEDLAERGENLEKFVQEAAKKYEFKVEEAILVGFSNGANIAINLLLRPNTPLKYGIIMAPLYPLEVDSSLDLSKTNVLLSMGEQDPICPVEESHKVVKLFEDRGAKVDQVWVRSHQITPAVIQAGQDWLETTF